MANLHLVNSPRLWVTSQTATDLLSKLHSPALREGARKVLSDADRLTRTAPFREGQEPAYGQAARVVQSHLECLTCAWILSRKAKYRAAAIKHLAGLLKWNQISCEANVNTPAEPKLPFCLSYGEQSTAIGLMYDHFRPDLTSDEQKTFFAVIDRFHMKQAVQCLTAPPWWANKAWSNWNGVCCGGMGVMALAFYDDRPDAQPLIPFVEKSLAEYFSSYVTNGGGCHEGTGYWNYGMNYAMRYVLSWENATGRKHPALKIKEIGQSLNFPVDFTGITFGDNDGWHPTCFYFRMAERLKLKNAALRAAAYLKNTPRRKAKRPGPYVANGDLLYAADVIPTDDELARLEAVHSKKKVPVARVYKGMDWAALADDEAFPKLRMSIRGGSAKVMGHGMVDLLSFHCQAHGEVFITDQKDTGYLTTTFGRRGSEIYPRSAAAKSTLFVEGLGPASDAVCKKTEVVKAKGLLGVRIDATGIYLQRMPAKFIGRLFLFVDDAYWLVIDHVVANSPVVELGIESRYHTYAKYKLGKNHVALTQGKEQLQMTFAAMQGGVMQLSRGMPPLPRGEQTTIFRWMGKERVTDNLHVVALCPGTRKAGLTLRKEKHDTYRIEIKRGDATRRIRISSELRLR
ncbi:MAG: hypothetical protein GC164_03875 [Phycisphaera sp.]|nr:hypothetical protein [Phycisphaera sp.]